MNEKLIEELREWGNTIGVECKIGVPEQWDDFYAILSRLSAEQGADKGEQGLREAVKPPSDLWGQHKAMIKLAQDHGLHLSANWAVNMSGKTFSKPPADKGLVEPLAVLADRKGYSRCCVKNTGNGNWVWRIESGDFVKRVEAAVFPKVFRTFVAPTYAAAEAKAREWLNGLSTGGGRRI